MTIFGPDLSRYQQGIDVARIAAEGNQFVIGKISQGATGRDPLWPTYRDQARANGLLLAGYHYVTGDDPAAQAANCAGAIGDPTIPLALDWEDQGGSWAHFLDVLGAFRAIGLAVRLAYCPRWYWTSQGSPDMSACGLPLWSSRYPSTAGGTPAELYRAVTAETRAGYGGLPVALLQFSDRATVAGRQTDVSAFEGTRDQLAALLSGSTVVPGPASSHQEVDTVNIPLVVQRDGTFYAQVPAEAGATSARFKGGWIAFSTAWGGSHFRVCAIGTDGRVMGPAAEKVRDLANNQRDTLPLPSGCVMVTVEGRVADPAHVPATVPAALWITDPR